MQQGLNPLVLSRTDYGCRDGPGGEEAVELSAFFDSAWFTWGVLPVLIFISRVCDVTIGTIRIIMVAKGRKLLSSLLGFLEVLIWLIAIGQIMKNLNNIACYIAYAGGFALGNFVGITLEEKLAMGELVVRIITHKDARDLMEHLRKAGYGVTSIDAQGTTGPVHIIYTIIKRKALPEVEETIKRFNPRAFYSIEDARSVNAGVFPAKTPLARASYPIPRSGSR